MRATKYSDDNNSSLTSGSYKYPDNNSQVSKEYGLLYTWTSAMNSTSAITKDSIPSGIQGICPKGWHLPSKNEWLKLDTVTIGGSNAQDMEPHGPSNYYVGSSAVKLAKGQDWDWYDLTGAPGHYTQESDVVDIWGFSALPAGEVNKNNNNEYVASLYHRKAIFWSSVACGNNNNYAYCQALWYHQSGAQIMNTNGNLRTNFRSVRCVRD